MNVDTDFTSAVIFIFLIFWLQSGWYRVDCALGTAKACSLIVAEYDAKAKP